VSRPLKEEGIERDERITVRVPADLVARADGLCKRWKAQHRKEPGQGLTRSDVVVNALREYLEDS
jgi:hypothetical protein